MSPADTPKLTLDSYLVDLLQASELTGKAWRDTENRLNWASDEVWVAQMYEVDRLKAQYRAHQDEICRYLKLAIENADNASA